MILIKLFLIYTLFIIIPICLFFIIIKLFFDIIDSIKEIMEVNKIYKKEMLMYIGIDIKEIKEVD